MTLVQNKKRIITTIFLSALIAISASSQDDAKTDGCPPPLPTPSLKDKFAKSIAKFETENEKRYGNAKVDYKLKQFTQHEIKNEFEEALLLSQDMLSLPNINAYAETVIYMRQGRAYYLMNRPMDTITAYEKALKANGFGDKFKEQLERNIITLKSTGELPIKKGNSLKITIADRDAQPLVRVPPIFPQKAKRSGHCKIKLDVSKKGHPINIEATSCTEKKFKKPSIKAVKNWKYNPKISNGRPVMRTGVETKVNFTLKDKCGAIIPEKGA